MMRPQRQLVPAEETHRTELTFLGLWDSGPRPPGWRLTPRAVVTFVVGSGDEELTFGRRPEGDSSELYASRLSARTARARGGSPLPESRS